MVNEQTIVVCLLFHIMVMILFLNDQIKLFISNHYHMIYKATTMYASKSP